MPAPDAEGEMVQIRSKLAFRDDAETHRGSVRGKAAGGARTAFMTPASARSEATPAPTQRYPPPRIPVASGEPRIAIRRGGTSHSRASA
jgi:hypothetical protein